MFQQGLSGLNGASKSLEVIGNNIANASTVGFKSSQAQFADLYANSLNGVSGTNAGIGVSVARLAQQFTQGNIETSNNPLDMAINGGGFFRMTVNGAIQYSRNGQFHMEKDGSIANSVGATLTGYLANKDGVILQGAPVPIKIDYSDLTPVATTKAALSLNLSSNSTVPGTVPFNAVDPNTYNKQTTNTVYDSLGNEHVMSMYYVKTSANNWDVYAGSDGTDTVTRAVQSAITNNADVIASRKAYQDAVKAVPVDAAAIAAAAADYAQVAGGVMLQAATDAGASQEQLDKLSAAFDPTTGAGTIAGTNPDKIDLALAAAVAVPAVKVATLVFDQNGALNANAMAALDPPQTLPVTISLPIFPSTGSREPLSIDVDFSKLTQYGSPTTEKPSDINGQSSGSLERFSIDENGVILGNYSNGKSRPLAQVALANFASPDGLIPLGNNAWAESSSSGQPQIGTPNSGQFGKVRSNAVETSNTDLTAELVNMITAQRVYQANAQTIKTEDQILQTLVNLR